MGQQKRREQNSSTQGNCMAGPSETEVTDFANQKVADYKVEKAPKNIDER